MKKWYATKRNGREVLSGPGFAAVLAWLFLGVPLLSIFLLVFVFKTRTLESIYGELKTGWVPPLVAVAGALAAAINMYQRERRRKP
ncbi:MAG TPA: hypothetical protein VEA92_03405 [Candidatus Paceibacterota bacterium]|nr:hypothetical protein [Candidatus Paceibacterota bacterium]